MKANCFKDDAAEVVRSIEFSGWFKVLSVLSGGLNETDFGSYDP